MAPISIEDVRAAAARLEGVAVRTPIHQPVPGVLCKAENEQHVRAFKFRGAYNAIAQLTDAERTRGVAAVSSGNHAQAVALAAKLLGAKATILMPHDAPAIKRAATAGHGAEIIGFDRYGADRDSLLADLVAERDVVPIHPYDNAQVMAGQGTVALELFEEAGALDVLLIPVGGGGLAAGCSTVAAALQPGCRVYGVEPAAGNDTARSLAAGERVRLPGIPRTIADGQQIDIPGELTFPVLARNLTGVLTVSDEEIVTAMRWAREHLDGAVLEPSGACALAAYVAGHVEGDRIGIVLSGGNVDPARYADLVGAPSAR